MKYSYKFLVVLGLVIIIYSQTTLACEVRFGWGQWPPFHYRNQQRELIGFDAELLRHIIKKIDCTLIPMETQLPAALKRLKKGSLQVTGSISFTQERAKFLHYSEPYRKEVIGLFVARNKKKEYDFQSLEELSKTDFLLGVNLGYYYGKSFAELKANGALTDNLQLCEGYISNLYNLREGKIDGFLMEIITGFMLLKQTKLENSLVQYPLIINDSNVYFVFSKKSVNLNFVNRFNQELIKAQNNGLYEQLKMKYFPTPHGQMIYKPD